MKSLAVVKWLLEGEDILGVLLQAHCLIPVAGSRCAHGPGKALVDVDGEG